MSLTFLIILSIIQGITEFLPISSSAHLILIPFFNENPYQGRSFDVCLHFGCLLAVLYYLKKDLMKKFKDLPNVKYQPNILEAIKSINLKEGDVLLITGSLYLAGEVLSLN